LNLALSTVKTEHACYTSLLLPVVMEALPKPLRMQPHQAIRKSMKFRCKVEFRSRQLKRTMPHSSKTSIDLNFVTKVAERDTFKRQL
jgi:hypothetical protein